jgi:hypothetical protein
LTSADRPTGWGGTDNDDVVSVGFELTPKDKHILELNHQGLSYRKISKRLKSDYGIELSKTAVSRRLRELRQDPGNGVKTLECSIPQKPREEGKWYKIIKRLQEAIPEYAKRFQAFF